MKKIKVTGKISGEVLDLDVIKQIVESELRQDAEENGVEVHDLKVEVEEYVA